MSLNTPRRDRSWISSLAALGSLVAASLCCLPILPLALAAGGASTAFLLASKYQIHLLALAALCIVYGIWQASRARQCSVQRRAVNFTLLTVAAGMTAASILFPQAIANLLVPSTATAGDGLSYTTLASATQFQEAFNAAPADAVKVVALYSPT